jgi:pimeloyl-ACP methyl ester carboxylesterase
MSRQGTTAIRWVRCLPLAILFVVNSLSSTAQKTSVMEKQVTTGYAPVNGIKMYYEIHGEGAVPLVLIHGGGSTIQTSYGTLLPLLSTNRKIIAVELQAHGRTSDRNAPETFDQDADDVAALLNYLKVSKADILGFSNGGSTTLKIAIRHPEIVNKIVVISGAYKRDGFISGFFDGFPHATLSNMPQPLQAAFLAVTPDQAKLQTMFEKDVQRMENFKDWPDDELKGIKAPALFMSSDKDVILPAHTLQMSRLVPGAEFAILPGMHGVLIGEAGSGEQGIKLAAITAGLVDLFLKE